MFFLEDWKELKCHLHCLFPFNTSSNGHKNGKKDINLMICMQGNFYSFHHSSFQFIMCVYMTVLWLSHGVLWVYIYLCNMKNSLFDVVFWDNARCLYVKITPNFIIDLATLLHLFMILMLENNNGVNIRCQNTPLNKKYCNQFNIQCIQYLVK